MLRDEGYESYRKVSLESKVAAADPYEMVLLLFDALLDEVIRAKGHIIENRLDKKGLACDKCLNILRGLDCALVVDQEDQLSQTIHELYIYCQTLVLQASIHDDETKLGDVEKIIQEIKTGWQGMMRNAND